jgi:histone acetyltransferase (RNA polymerase elongator complex component)
MDRPDSLIFRHPEPAKPGHAVRPVFLPNAGCPGRCLYCRQETQTGAPAAALEDAYASLRRDLEAAAASGRPPFEIGFFGGTFTALPGDFAHRFVALAGEFKRRGVVARVRCSTRPDAVPLALLRDLAGLGLDLVELGVQSFSDAVLAASRRDYGEDAAREACEAVRASGLGLGLQLLPGLPRHGPEDFRRDIEAVLAIKPECLRIYPCLVIAGTPLAVMHARGEYAPWPLETAAEAIARALPGIWRAGVRILRLGLAPQPELVRGVVAGPWHRSFGSLVRGRALKYMIEDALAGRALDAARLPRRYQGEFFGYKGELVPAYEAMGLAPGKAAAWDAAHFALQTA